MALALVVVAGMLVIAACGSSSSSKSGGGGAASASTGLYGALPASAGSASSGGTLTFSQLQGSTPTYIMPITPAANASIYGAAFFQYEMYEPLYNSTPSLIPSFDTQLSVGEKPVFSAGGKTVTINLHTGYTWANGAPVDADDVVFFIDLVKQAVKESAANFSAYTPGQFPDNVVSATATSKYQVTLTLTKQYNPSFFYYDQLNEITPMPSTDWNVASANGPHLDYTNPANAKKIYDYLSSQGGKLADFASNPLWKDADGPFVIKSFSPTNGEYTLDTNLKYSGPDKPHVAAITGVTYTGITPLLNAEKTGAVDIGTVDPSQLGEVSTVKRAGYSVFGYPALAWTGAFFNFKDKTDDFGKVITQLYARQALAHLEDQSAYVTGVLKGAGGQAYGPAPSIPKTQFTPSNATTNPYPYSVADARKLLTSNGWKVVPNGKSTCIKPGTGTGECGAGIPAGTPFEMTWDYLTPTNVAQQSLESDALASQAAKIGIKINLVSKAFNYLISTDNDLSTPQNDNNWGVVYFGGFTDDLYPTQSSIFNTGGSYNQGAYTSAKTDALINQSVYSSNPSAVKNELTQETDDLPILFFPNPDLIEAVKSDVGGPSGSLASLTSYGFWPQLYYLKKSS